MAGKRTKDITGSQTTFEKELVLLVDRIDTGSGDWLTARKLELGLLGNTYFQGSSNGINWHNEILSTDTYFRYSSDGGTTWKLLTTDNVREGSTNQYYTNARVSANVDVVANTIARHTHTNKDALDNIINTGPGTAFLADDGVYKFFGDIYLTKAIYDTDGDGVLNLSTVSPHITYEQLDSISDVGNAAGQLLNGDYRFDDSEIVMTNDGAVSHLGSLQEHIAHTSNGYVSQGTVITDNGDGTVHVTAGELSLKTSALYDSSYEAVVVPATDLAVPIGAIPYVIIARYNSGSPTYDIIVGASGYLYSNWDALPIATVVNISSEILINSFASVGTNTVYKLSLLHINTEPIQKLGGLVVTETGTRNLAISAGAILLASEYKGIDSIDTSVSDTFTSIYYNGSDWIRTSGQTTVDNTQYNDISSGLVSLNANYSTIKWVYYVYDDPSRWVILHGQEQYASLSEAYSVEKSSFLPPELTSYYAGSYLVGRIIVQQGRSTFVAISDPTSKGYAVEPYPLTKSYPFTSQGIGAGTYYNGGFYDYPTTSVTLTQASLTQTYATTNRSHASHPFIVASGAGTVNTGQVGLRVTGTKIEDNGTRTTSFSYVLTDDITTLTANQFIEASKFIGTVTFQLYTVSGTPTTYSVSFNYGLAKYEDFNNSNFELTGIEVTGLASASDTGFNIELLHHKSTGWTYAASGFVPALNVITSLQSVHASEYALVNGKYFAFKVAPISYSSIIDGEGSEGVLTRITTTLNNSVQSMVTHITGRRV